MTKMKKLTSVLLAVVMAMGLMVPAWAASPLDTVKFSNLSDEDFQFNSKSQLYYAKAF